MKKSNLVKLCLKTATAQHIFARTMIRCFFVFLYMGYCSAYAIALPEESRVPGGIALLPLNHASALQAPKVYMGKKRIMVLPHADHWLAVVGLSVKKAAGNRQLSIRWTKQTEQMLEFVLSDKPYPEQRLVIKDKDKVEPSEKDLERIWAEQKRINKAKYYWTEETPDFTLALPTKGLFSSLYGLKRFFNDKPRSPHRGLDIAAATGTPVYAPSNGVVTEIGDFFFTGNTVFIAHGQGMVSMYAHLSRIDVKVGDQLQTGRLIGAIGATGRVTGPHLHWSVGLNGVWVDPALFLKPEDRP